jgi:hypothetical protein
MLAAVMTRRLQHHFQRGDRMKRTALAIVGLAAITCTVAFAQAPKDDKPKAPAHTGAPQDQMPPAPKGWTDAEWQACMQACMEAGMPGDMHNKLVQSSGVWTGKGNMWMASGAEPMPAETTSTIKPIMDGRYITCEVSSDMMGMPFRGQGTYGYDNTTKKFQCSWIDNCSTAMMTGTGEMSSDGSTITWTYNYTCPYTKKPVTMREVHKTTGKDSQTFEMYTIDPKTNKEYKMMELAMTRKPGTAITGAEHSHDHSHDGHNH